MKLTRRDWLLCAGASTLAAAEPIIDIHQHTNYSGRSDADLLRHQRTMGITKTVLLPAGSKFGLEADAGGNDTVMSFSKQHRGEFIYFANELPDIPEAASVIRRYLKSGAIGIGEQKFQVECDSPHIYKIAEIAREHRVPVLMHFQHGKYNVGFERFHKVLEKFPDVNFIGHAQTWWGHIDKKHEPAVMYPKTRVTPGGLTDRYLADYPNVYGDLSAGSGLNSMLRDEEHAREFLKRHQDKLMYGSDCNDKIGEGPKCSGTQCLAAVRRLAPDARAIRKILHDNAASVLKIR